MAIVAKCLVQPKYMDTSQTGQYSSSARSVIDKFTVTNTAAGNVEFSVNLVPSGNSASNANLLIDRRTLAADECYRCPELVGHVLDAGDIISTIAYTGSALVLRVSGREIS